MPNPYIPTNREEESWQFLFERDKNYNFSKNQAFQKFQEKHLATKVNNWDKFILWVNSLVETLKIFFVRNTALASLLTVFCFFTITASAMELAAPLEYKPSNILKNINPNSVSGVLARDSDNDIGTSNECDMRIKYPKQIDTQLVSFYKLKVNPNTKSVGGLVIRDKVNSPSLNNLSTLKLHSFILKCFDKNQEINDFGNTYTSSTRQKLKEKFNWFIFESDIKNIQTLEKSGVFYLEFVFQEKKYQIQTSTKKNQLSDIQEKWLIEIYKKNGYFEREGLFGRQLNLEFDFSNSHQEVEVSEILI